MKNIKDSCFFIEKQKIWVDKLKSIWFTSLQSKSCWYQLMPPGSTFAQIRDCSLLTNSGLPAQDLEFNLLLSL